MTERPAFENYPATEQIDHPYDEAVLGRPVAASTGPVGVVAPGGKRGTTRRNIFGHAVAASIGAAAVTALAGGPLWLAAGGMDDDGEAYAESLTFEGLHVGEDFIDIGDGHSVQIRDGWLAEAIGPAHATLTRGYNQLSLWTFELSDTYPDAARELRAAATRLLALPKGAILSSIETTEGGGAYAGGAGTWSGRPVQVMLQLSIRHRYALLASFWLTDGLGSKAFREGYQMMGGASGW